MKLLYITNGITGVGGLERVLSVRASWLAERGGHQVHIASLDEAGRDPFYRFSPLITRHDVDTGRWRTGYFAGLRRVVRRVRPDIIAVCDDGLKGFFVPLWIGRRGARMIYERHVSLLMTTGGRPPGVVQRVVRTLMRLGGRLYDRFVVLTEGGRAEWRGRNVRVISNPLSFYPADVSPLTSRRVIAVGKVTPQKGFDRLIEAWRTIAYRHPGWRIDIFGSSSADGAVERMAERTPGVTIHPPVADIAREYLASSVCALPSRWEGFGMVLTEAMACGVPCVAFDCPCGPADIVRHGEDGFLVPEGDVEGFARRLSQLMDNAGLRREMGVRARRNVLRYDIENIAARWEDLFNELRPAPRPASK